MDNKTDKQVDNKSDRWKSIENIDVNRHKPNEWAKLYHMKLIKNTIDDLWNEYEWAYYLFKDLKYQPLPDKNGDYEKANSMEMRALEIRRDLFMNADEGEKYVLQTRYIETEWVRRKSTFI